MQTATVAPGSGCAGHRQSRSSITTATLTVVGFALVEWSAGLHLYLWFRGYSDIAVIGPLFLLQAAAGIAGAPIMAWRRRPLAALTGAGYLASTAAGLLISVRYGTFGFHESLAGPYVGLSLCVEGAGVVVLVLAALTGAAARGWRRSVPSNSPLLPAPTRRRERPRSI